MTINNISHLQAQITISDSIPTLITMSCAYMKSKIESGESYDENFITTDPLSGTELSENYWNCESFIGGDLTIQQGLLLSVISGDINAIESSPLEPALYYYHPDCLCSTTWITDTTGNSVQFLQYLPYGEVWRNQQSTGYDERFKFTGKERDAETGYYYFGARYYDSRVLTSWLSIDPLMDKYPNTSPYAYCAWNPLKYLDEYGLEKKNFFHSKKMEEQHFVTSYSDDKRLHIFSHGINEGQGIQLFINDKKINIAANNNGAEQLSLLLSTDSKSNLWIDFLEGTNNEALQVVLHGCKTAPMAEALSKEYPNAYFTGTTENNHSENGKEIGPYKTIEIKIGNYIDIDTNIKIKDGYWNTYYNGELIRQENKRSPSPIIIE